MPKNWYMACAKSLNSHRHHSRFPLRRCHIPFLQGQRHCQSILLMALILWYWRRGFWSGLVTWRWYVAATCSCILRTNAIALRTYKPTVPKQSFIWGIDRWKSSSVSAYDSAKTACFTLVLHKSTTTLINSRYDSPKRYHLCSYDLHSASWKNQSLSICCIPCCCLFYGFVLIWCFCAHIIY